MDKSQLLADMATLRAALATALEERDKLQAALRPFAQARILPGAPDCGLLSGWLDEYEGAPTVADIRRAAALFDAHAAPHPCESIHCPCGACDKIRAV